MLGNGYIAVHTKAGQCEVYADSSYEAQRKATAILQAKNPRRKIKSYDVSVYLCESNGKQVVHSTASI